MPTLPEKDVGACFIQVHLPSNVTAILVTVISDVDTYSLSPQQIAAPPLVMVLE
jgi:hypothetical protein